MPPDLRPRETRNVIAERPDLAEAFDQFVDRRISEGPSGEGTALSPEEERRLEATLEELGYL